jgi:anti-sigma regulatory factor (Ser/Thr protein kinase)
MWNQWFLDPVPEAAGQARKRLRAALTRWGMTHLGDDAAMVVSELVANASAASADGPGYVTVCLFADEKRLRAEVWDLAPGVPEVRHSGDGDESGRGLQLVEALAADWGWIDVRGTKVVWAELDAGACCPKKEEGNAV